ncbi:MAG: hypothetical protein PARBA_03417 [Parabacteroides sp.]
MNFVILESLDNIQINKSQLKVTLPAKSIVVLEVK